MGRSGLTVLAKNRPYTFNAPNAISLSAIFSKVLPDVITSSINMMFFPNIWSTEIAMSLVKFSSPVRCFGISFSVKPMSFKYTSHERCSNKYVYSPLYLSSVISSPDDAGMKQTAHSFSKKFILFSIS